MATEQQSDEALHGLIYHGLLGSMVFWDMMQCSVVAKHYPPSYILLQ
jgi:hypothetical protein